MVVSERNAQEGLEFTDTTRFRRGGTTGNTYNNGRLMAGQDCGRHPCNYHGMEDALASSTRHKAEERGAGNGIPGILGMAGRCGRGGRAEAVEVRLAAMLTEKFQLGLPPTHLKSLQKKEDEGATKAQMETEDAEEQAGLSQCTCRRYTVRRIVSLPTICRRRASRDCTTRRARSKLKI